MAYQNKKRSQLQEITPVNTAPLCPTTESEDGSSEMKIAVNKSFKMPTLPINLNNKGQIPHQFQTNINDQRTHLMNHVNTRPSTFSKQNFGTTSHLYQGLPQNNYGLVSRGKNQSIHMPLPLVGGLSKGFQTSCNIHNYHQGIPNYKPVGPLPLNSSSNNSAFLPMNSRLNQSNITQNTFGQLFPLNSNFGTVNPITNCVIPKLGRTKANSSGVNSDGSIPINPHSRTSSRGSRDNDFNNFQNLPQGILPMPNLNPNLMIPSPYLTPIQTSPIINDISQSNLQARQLADPSQILNNNLPGAIAKNNLTPQNNRTTKRRERSSSNTSTTKTFLLGRNNEANSNSKQLRNVNHRRIHGRYAHFWKLTELDRKAYLIQPLDITQSIILLKHAKNCAKASGIDLTRSRLAGQTCNCSVPHCGYFRELLAHFRHCVANSAGISNTLLSNCGKAHCQQVKLIYYHTFTCGNGTKCQVCHPGERPIYSYQRANSSNSTSTASSSENSSTTSSISSNKGSTEGLVADNRRETRADDSKYIIRRRLQSPKEILGCRCC